MSTFKLVISSPDGDVFKGEAVMLTLRGSEGDLAILAGHIPFITAVQPCDCKILLDDGSEMKGHTESGLLTVDQDQTTLLSGTFTMNK